MVFISSTPTLQAQGRRGMSNNPQPKGNPPQTHLIFAVGLSLQVPAMSLGWSWPAGPVNLYRFISQVSPHLLNTEMPFPLFSEWAYSVTGPALACIPGPISLTLPNSPLVTTQANLGVFPLSASGTQALLEALLQLPSPAPPIPHMSDVCVCLCP